MKHIIDDGFNPELVQKAFFQGIFEIPKINAPKEIIVPKNIIPFTKRKQSKEHSEFLHFYEHDIKFKDVLLSTNLYIYEHKRQWTKR